MKLRYKLPIYYIIIWIICIASFWILSLKWYNIINNSVQNNFNESAKSISYDIDLFLNEKIRDIKTLTKNSTIIEAIKNNKWLQNELNNYILINNSFNYIEIKTSSWEIIWRSDIVQREDTSYFYIVWEKWLLSDKNNLLSSNDNYKVWTIQKNEFWQPSINIIFSDIEVWNKKYNIIWNLNIKFIDRIISNNIIWNNSDFCIRNEKWKIIYKVGNLDLKDWEKVIIWESNLNWVKWYNWTIIIKQLYAEAYKDVTILWFLFTWLGLFVFLSIIFLIIVIFKNFTFPLSRLMKTVKEITDCDSAECNYTTSLDTERKDELWFLAVSFNKMIDNIRGNNKALKEYKWLIDESSLVARYSKDWKINYVNDKFCEISGYPRNKIIWKTMNFLKHKDAPDEVFQDVWDTINIKKIWKGTIKFKNKKGYPYWASMIVAPILDSNDKIVEFISIWHDISELEQTKEELKDSYKKLQDSTTKLIEKERIWKEFQLAEQIQNDFLPKLNEINIEGLDMFFWIKSATEIWWDLYDVITQKSDPNNILFYIWDVTWHWLISWMMMAVCNTLIYWLANKFTDIVEILKILNFTLFHKLPDKVFITLVLLQYNKKTWEFIYLWAGHEKILIYRKKTDAIEEIKSWGDAIWMFKNTKRDIKATPIKINSWDIILLYTDWITEARNKKWDFFGLDKLKESFKLNAHRKTDLLYASIQKDLLDYVWDTEIVDDITLFIIKKM